MVIYPKPEANGCTVELTADERSALIWALEVARALILFDDGIYTLLAEDTVTPEALDHLADRLFVAGCPERVAG
jgi:hypothetical protein